MSENFPALSSFGTLFRYAQELEQSLAALATRAARLPAGGPHQAALETCARKHSKRATLLERARRERLNEVVLQPISGMERADYLPPSALSDEQLVAGVVAAAEETTARFYEDAAAIAANVLVGVDKTFRKLGAESRELAATLRR